MLGAVVAPQLPLEQNFMVIGSAGLPGMMALMLVSHQACRDLAAYGCGNCDRRRKPR